MAHPVLPPVQRPFFSGRRWFSLALLTLTVTLLLAGQGALRAQDTESDNPTGPSGDFNGDVTTAGRYDPLTGNAKRQVTDLVVPGSNGAYPLAFGRTYNSQLAPVAGDKAVLGDGSNWRHSYEWGLSVGSFNNYNGNVTAYTLAYPDGSVITFRPPGNTGRSGAPASELSTYWRGPSGTTDRLEVQDANHLYLHTSDGGLVKFENSSHPNAIVDPYGAVTRLSYLPNNANYLAQVTEPGGRWLKFSYQTYTYQAVQNGFSVKQTWTLLSQVQASTGQTVTFTEVQQGSHDINLGTVPYYVLTDVSYDSEPLQSGQGNVHAGYSYNTATVPPVMLTATDPHYAGAMKQIRYTISNVTSGISLEEQNLNTSQRVSHLDSNFTGGTQTTATETRGDTSSGTGNTSGAGASLTRTFSYGSNNPAIPGDPTPQVKPSLLTSLSDFEAHTTYRYYYTGAAKDTYGKSFLQSILDANGNVTSYQHEPLTGKVTWTQLPDGRVRTASWRGADDTSTTFPYYLYQTVDERGHSVTYHHQANGSVTQVDYPDGVEHYSYQPFGSANGGNFYKVAVYTNKLGGQIIYHYDEANHGGSGYQGLLTSVTRSYLDVDNGSHSETTNFHYDPLDRLDQSTDQRGVSDIFAYNARHQVTTVIHVSDGLNPHSHVDTLYDDWGRSYQVTDEMGHATSTQYDEYSRPKSVTVPVNAAGNVYRTTNFTYDRRDNGNAVRGDALSHTSGAFSYQILPSGRAVWRVYTPCGRLSDEYTGQSNGSQSNPALTQSLHDQANLTYDPMGHLRQSTDAQGQVWQQSYDTCGRPRTSTDPLGHVTTTTYYAASDAYAGLVKQVDAPGNNAVSTATTQYTGYDVMGRCTGWTDPQNNGFGSSFDAQGNLTGQTDGMPTSSHPATVYAYDQLGRKGRIAYADGTYQQWKYDPSGNVHSFRNRNQKTQTYGAYDGRNRPTGYSWDDGVTPAAGMAFDPAGRCTGYSNGYSNLVMTYDDSGALKTEQQCIGGGSTGPTMTYTSDADGRVGSVTYPTNPANGTTDSASWDYDFMGRMLNTYVTVPSVGATNQWLTNYTYTADWLTKRLTVAGAGTGYAYQANNRISVVQQYTGSRNISWRNYGYYPNGQMSWFNRAQDANSPSKIEQGQGDAYYYQGDGQLYFVYNESQNVYNGNPDTHGDSSPTGPSGGARINQYGYDAAGNRTYDNESGTISQPTYDGENRHISYGYDDAGNPNGNGNVTTGVANNGIWRYTYDAFNQLLSASSYPYSSVAARFVYDPLGRLCQRTINGVTTNLYYMGGKLIAEHNASNGNRICSYIYGAGGERADRLNGDYSSTFYHFDARGFVTHLTDSGGNVVEQYLYDAFGQPFIYDGSGQQSRGQTSAVSNNRYLWAADYEWYPELGLYRCGARFYDPTCGHWLQPDPIGQAGGLNIYTYCHNDPINKNDPSGLADPVAGGMPHPLDTDPSSSSSDDPRDADSTTASNYTPTGSHIPAVIYDRSNSYGYLRQVNIPWQGAFTLYQSSPSVTTVGGLGAVAPDSGDGYSSLKMGVTGTSQGYAAALKNANVNNELTLYNIWDANKSNPILDILMDVYQKIFGSYNNQSAIDEKAWASGYASPPHIDPYSEGNLDTVEAISIGMKASSINWQASPVTTIGEASAARQAGAISTYDTKYFDVINLVAPALNPLKFLSGLPLPYSVHVHTSSYSGF